MRDDEQSCIAFLHRMFELKNKGLSFGEIAEVWGRGAGVMEEDKCVSGKVICCGRISGSLEAYHDYRA